MDRGQRKDKLADILEKITPKVVTSMDNNINSIMYNVVGFVPVTDFLDNGLFIANLGYLIAQENLNVCIVDFKVFNPNIYQFLDAKPNEKGKGLLEVLKNDKEDIRRQVIATKYKKLFLLSPSPYDLIEEYLEFKFSTIKRVINELKDMFDIVLVDIPNNPPLEFCTGAMKYIHRGFFVSAQRTENSINILKLLDFAKSIGVSTAKFNSIIFFNTQDLQYDYNAITQLGFNIVAKMPVVKGAISDYLQGKLYVKDSALIDKEYITGMKNLVSTIVAT